MAALTGTQLTLELRAELLDRQAQLGESLAPLVTDLQAALTRRDARAAIERFHASYLDQGHDQHRLSVVNSAGQVVVGTPDDGVPGQQALLTAAIPLVSPALEPEPLTLIVTGDGSDFSAARLRRWKGWAVHVGVTALLTLALLLVVIRHEVTGPIGRLLGGVRNMELGYWDGLPDPGGAWEVRWLGWRFRTLGQELNRTVEHLVAAQRRAYALDRVAHTDTEVPTAGAPASPDRPVHLGPRVTLAQLRARLERLRRADPGDPATRSLARVAWDHHAPQAERLGQPGLRTSLEDAALRVLDPDGFLDISRRIQAERHRLEALARARGEQLHRALAARHVPVVEICHRVKHPAGIWKKMRHKTLAFNQVHDLVALRIIVPTETDCYHALGVVQDLYALIFGRFKDYVVRPKANGYRGLHVCVRDPEGAVFEVQIRSIAMHRHAEQGPAAHADYKDATRIPASPARIAPWQRLLGAGRQPRESQ